MKRIKLSIHARELVLSVAHLKELCDVTLVSGIDNQQFPAHRLILIASSKYFEALFGPNFREGSEKEIVLKEIDGPTLKTILEFIYTADIKISAENVFYILAAASSMELIALGKECSQFCADNLSIENCVEFFLNADKYHLPDLRLKALEFICDHFEVVPVDDFEQIDENNFKELLKHDQITAAETIIFDRLVEWMERRKTELVGDLLNVIRLKHIPIAFLIGTIEPFCKNNGNVKIFMDEYHKRLLNPMETCSHRYVPKAIYCSFVNSFQSGIDIKKYDLAENNWNDFKTMTFVATKYSFGLVLVNGELMLLGGYHEHFVSQCDFVLARSVEKFTTTYLNNVETYNLDESTRTTLPSMTKSKSDFTPIIVGKYVYVFGGRNESLLDDCECFDIEKHVWESRQKMPKAVSGYAATEFDGKIYVTGGYDDATTENYSYGFYCYDPNANLWFEKSYINGDKKNPAFGKTKHNLYAFGANKTLHQYDIARNIWTMIGRFDSPLLDIQQTEEHCGLQYVLRENGEFGVINIGAKRIVTPLQKATGALSPYLFIQ